VVTDCNHRYILQKINCLIFKDTDALMRNIEAVTSWLRKQTDDPRRVLRLVKTKDGRTYFRHTDGTPWRVYDFVEHSVCLQLPETPADFYSCLWAKANRTVSNTHQRKNTPQGCVFSLAEAVGFEPT